MSHENDTDEERINRKHTHPVADGGSKYREPIHADADRSEVPHDYEGPTKLVRKTTPRPSGNVTEEVELPDREEKARREREQDPYTGVGDDDPLEKAVEEAWSNLDDAGESDVSKSRQEKLVDALEDENYLGIDGPRRPEVDTKPVDLSWSKEDFKPVPTEVGLLAEIRDELAGMNAGERERAVKSLYDDMAAVSGADTEQDDVVATLERVEDRLAAEEPARLTEEQAEQLEDIVNVYVEAAPENGLEDPLSEVWDWVADVASAMEGESRRQVYAALAGVQTAAREQGETPV